MTSRQEKLCAALLSATALPLAFMTIASTAAVHQRIAPVWMISDLDLLLPLVPVAVWSYVSWYVAPAVILLADRVTFRRAWIAEWLAFGVCALGYIAWPVGMHRPDVHPGGGASAALLAVLYRLDPPVNIFPSYHAAVAAIIVVLVRR